MRRSSASINDDEMFDFKSLSDYQFQQKSTSSGRDVSIAGKKPPTAEVPAAKKVKHHTVTSTAAPTDVPPATQDLSADTSSAAESKIVKKKPPKPYKKFVQPPMWSSRPKPAVIIEIPIPEDSTISKSSKKRAPPQAAPPPEEEKKIVAEDEFDPFKFLEMLRAKAIEYAQKKKYKQLSELYSFALTKFPQNPNFHCNRSFAFQKMEYYGKALDDANKAIELNDLHKRAYHRRAAAYLGLGMVVNALDDFEQLMKLCPKSQKVKCKYLHCQKALNRCIFESLISDNMSEHQIGDLVSYETIKIEDSYNGPRLRTEKMNPNFLWTLMKYYRTEGILHRKYVYKILFDMEALLKNMPSLIYIEIVGAEDTLTVCGDIQGQYFDLIHIFDTNGFPSHKRKYLFNGNFIGKGSFSVEVAILLFAFKILFPSKFFIARGHHETLAMMKVFGFEKEVNTKYSPVIFQIFTRIFQWLPLAHCINKKILVLHGGLFNENNVTLDAIRDLPRNMEPIEGDVKLSDILWSDPQKDDGKQKNLRGMGGILFGPDVTEAFLRQNELDYIIRSHEYKVQGYWEDHDGKCITVFSAPNFCDTYGNKGAYIVLTGKELQKTYTMIEAQYHPDVPPLYYADSIYQVLK